MKFECLFAVHDDLHQYAARVIREGLADLSRPLFGTAWYGVTFATVLHRQGRFQTEMVCIKPDTVLPPHRHPQVDSIEFMLSGSLSQLVVAGRSVLPLHSEARRARAMLNRGVRINQCDLHDVVIGPHGATFLSIQRWDIDALSHIGDQWAGHAVSEEHGVRIHAS